MLEPTTLPMAISEAPLVLASIFTMSSGILVPILTIVRPITMSEILYFLGWMFSIGFTLSRLIYQKFKQIQNTKYKNILSNDGRSPLFQIFFT